MKTYIYKKTCITGQLWRVNQETGILSYWSPTRKFWIASFMSLEETGLLDMPESTAKINFPEAFGIEIGAAELVLQKFRDLDQCEQALKSTIEHRRKVLAEDELSLARIREEKSVLAQSFLTA